MKFPFHLACPLAAAAALLVLSSAANLVQGAPHDDDNVQPRRAAKKSSVTKPATPSARKKVTTPDDEEDSPAAKTPAPKRAKAAPEDVPAAAATPKPATPRKKGASAPETSEVPAEEKGKRVGSGDAPEAVPPVAPPPQATPAPAATIASGDLKEFADQPEAVKSLIEDALALTKLNLTYKFGSDDPAQGGMDCSGTISYLLRRHGLKDVPRDASGQYVWARKNGKFFAVNSRQAGGFEFSDLQPGDLMFWSGTYQADRDPPVTHSMIYLGVEKKRKQQVMFGSSDGRTYDGKQRFGVSVFDFRMPRAEASGTGGRPAVFLGYARVPGLREPALPQAAEETKELEPAAGEPQRKKGSTPAPAKPRHSRPKTSTSAG